MSVPLEPKQTGMRQAAGGGASPRRRAPPPRPGPPAAQRHRMGRRERRVGGCPGSCRPAVPRLSARRTSASASSSRARIISRSPSLRSSTFSRKARAEGSAIPGGCAGEGCWAGAVFGERLAVVGDGQECGSSLLRSPGATAHFHFCMAWQRELVHHGRHSHCQRICGHAIVVCTGAPGPAPSPCAARTSIELCLKRTPPPPPAAPKVSCIPIERILATPPSWRGSQAPPAAPPPPRPAALPRRPTRRWSRRTASVTTTACWPPTGSSGSCGFRR